PRAAQRHGPWRPVVPRHRVRHLCERPWTDLGGLSDAARAGIPFARRGRGARPGGRAAPRGRESPVSPSRRREGPAGLAGCNPVLGGAARRAARGDLATTRVARAVRALLLLGTRAGVLLGALRAGARAVRAGARRCARGVPLARAPR